MAQWFGQHTIAIIHQNVQKSVFRAERTSLSDVKQAEIIEAFKSTS